MNKFQLVTLLCLFLSLNTFADNRINLKDAYKKAIANNQLTKISDAKISASEESVVQSNGSFYPKIYLKGTATKQENLNDIRYANLYLSHNLYKGGKDEITSKLSTNAKTSIVTNKDLDLLNLYNSVINAYFNLVLYENDAKNLELLSKQSNDRVLEIEKRVSIGRSRLGELLQAKAQLAQAKAQLENANGLYNEAKQKFSVLIGENNLLPAIDLEVKNKNYDYLKVLNDANKRPDIKLKELKVDEANLNLSLARRSHLPTLDLTSNYYLTDRVGTSYTKTKWDVGLTLTFPLFEGFVTDSKVNENVWKEHESRYVFLDAKKSVELDLASKFEIHKRYVDQIESFDLAQTLAKKSYDEAMKDYRLGLISNLDVLTALNLYLDTKRNTEKNRIQAILSEKILEAAIGNLPE